MLTPHVSTTPAIGQPLTSSALVRDFGARADVTRKGVRVLHETLTSAFPTALAQWRNHFGKWGGRALEKSPKHLVKLAKRYGVSPRPALTPGPSPETGEGSKTWTANENADTLLFAMQTYYALLVNRVVDRASNQGNSDLLPGNLFSWYSTSPSKAVQQLIDRVTDMLAGYRPASSPATDDDDCDLFKSLYQNLFPRALRHAWGEYYTPDWLARHVLDQVGYTGQLDQRLLDPACGSGTFLVMALRRLKARAEGGGRKAESPSLSTIHYPLSTIPSALPVVGFDLNPLAVLTARANYLINIVDMLSESGQIEIPVYLYDSILGEPELQNTTACGFANVASFDYVVGNPPWIAWDNLPEEYRQATKPLWERCGLFSLSGNEARHGGGKKDLSMLMLYTAADRYLKPDGRLGMVITQTVFQSKGAGDGFRRFRLGADGPPLRVLRVDDFVAMRPFVDAANWTSTIALQKGEVTEYPVEYFKWGGERRAEEVASGQWLVASNSEIRNQKSEISNPQSPIPNPFSPVPCLACPIDPAQPNSPWLILERNDESSTLRPPPSALRPRNIHPSDYTAHLGANSGGANGVYWMEVLEAAGGREKGSGPICRDQPSVGARPPGASHKLDLTPFLVRVRNIAARGKHPIETVEQTIEADLLYPLLRWSDVQRWSAAPRSHILLCQDPATRSGIAENVMSERYPRTLEYLERFRELLTARAAYRRYQGTNPFYSMYNVGPYTVAPIKVVWRRMDRRINAVVVEMIDDPLLGRRPIVPQETCVLVACESSDEAHYVCAMLNSAIVGELISACSVRGGKGFGTPGILDYIPLCQYRADDPRHIELSTLSRKAHVNEDVEVQRRIDRLVAEFYNSVQHTPR